MMYLGSRMNLRGVRHCSGCSFGMGAGRRIRARQTILGSLLRKRSHVRIPCLAFSTALRVPLLIERHDMLTLS